MPTGGGSCGVFDRFFVEVRSAEFVEVRLRHYRGSGQQPFLRPLIGAPWLALENLATLPFLMPCLAGFLPEYANTRRASDVYLGGHAQEHAMFHNAYRFMQGRGS